MDVIVEAYVTVVASEYGLEVGENRYSSQNIMELYVLHYHKTMAIYHYPFLVVIT